MNLDHVYPYERDEQHHEFAWCFFNAEGLSVSLDLANALARHIFDDLGCGGPGSSSEPTVKYDALGGAGAPWEPGVWIPMEESRVSFVATAPDKVITDMSDAERAELRAALDAADDAARVAAAEGGAGDGR